MSIDQWSKDVAARVAERIRATRDAAGLTVPELAQLCADRGLAIPRTTITNLETGRRTSVDLAEFLVIADALGIPPISLLFPVGTAATVEALPGRAVSTWEAVAWFTGETPSMEIPPAGSERELLDTFRAHDESVAAAATSTALAKDRRRKAGTTLDPSRRADLLAKAAGYEELAFDDCRDLRTFRDRMRARGLTPPALPAELAFVDQPEDHSEIGE
ncbi:helix-turn-helix transcriptional regulator [Streptomyces kaniharaensis]|uniref:Helix-turn-helix transcriptional regulator n=1 Tax=Streptomyces kaniharaensis TaxID=212423 RepID=A0A6N7KSX0_9ACTN|nr:helix-turn-helix transcriptional regulator [Streptomyces kaniharaensis]MQS14696.1 helix-turn-helix transcriptional regulator [Streptomyces kaniharaensis]